MSIKNNLKKAYLYIIEDKCTLSLILFLLFILFTSIILRLYFNNKRYENFDAVQTPVVDKLPVIDKGIGQVLKSGTINFKKQFTVPPFVFTQIIGSNQTVNNAYSVQVYNITNTGFDYSKNTLENKPAGDFVALTLSPSTSETFSWIAFQ
jgi:hypothetical protein